MAWPTALHKLVSDEVDATSPSWLPSVLSRCRSHPHEVGVQGAGYGQTALHVAFMSTRLVGGPRRSPLPAEVVRALLEACPRAALLRNSDGETPLHLALLDPSSSSSYDDGSDDDLQGREEVQSLLLDAAPTAARLPDRSGDTPLHHAALSGSSTRLLRKMVASNPGGVVTPNRRGETPFSLLMLCDSGGRVLELGARSLEDVTRRPHGHGGGGGGRLADCWERAVLFLRAAASAAASSASDDGATASSADANGARNGDDGDEEESEEEPFQILHAAAAEVRCPRSVLRVACRLYPDQALIRDAHGRTPLAIAAAAQICDEPERALHSAIAELDSGDDDEGYRAVVEHRLADVMGGGPAHIVEEEAESGSDHHQQLLLQGALPLHHPNYRSVGEDYRSISDGEDASEPAAAPGQHPPQHHPFPPPHHQHQQHRDPRIRPHLPPPPSSVIDILLHASPTAASIPDVHGRLPLTLAVQSGKTWDEGVGSILKAEPRALRTRDGRTGLYPFMTAASAGAGRGTTDDACFVTTYELLRALPELVRCGIPPDGEVGEPSSSSASELESSTSASIDDVKISSLSSASSPSPTSSSARYGRTVTLSSREGSTSGSESGGEKGGSALGNNVRSDGSAQGSCCGSVSGGGSEEEVEKDKDGRCRTRQLDPSADGGDGGAAGGSPGGGGCAVQWGGVAVADGGGPRSKRLRVG